MNTNASNDTCAHSTSDSSLIAELEAMPFFGWEGVTNDSGQFVAHLRRDEVLHIVRQHITSDKLPDASSRNQSERQNAVLKTNRYPIKGNFMDKEQEARRKRKEDSAMWLWWGIPAMIILEILKPIAALFAMVMYILWWCGVVVVLYLLYQWFTV